MPKDTQRVTECLTSIKKHVDHISELLASWNVPLDKTKNNGRLTFGNVVDALQQGYVVMRLAWIEYPVKSFNTYVIYVSGKEQSAEFNASETFFQPYMVRYSPTPSTWLPTAEDIFATDWIIIKKP